MSKPGGWVGFLWCQPGQGEGQWVWNGSWNSGVDRGLSGELFSLLSHSLFHIGWCIAAGHTWQAMHDSVSWSREIFLRNDS